MSTTDFRKFGKSGYYDRLLRRTNNRKRQERIASLRKMRVFFWLVIVSGILYGGIHFYQKWQLANESVVTTAIIDRVKFQSYSVNEYSRQKVTHYYIYYKYKVKEKPYRAFGEVLYRDKSKFFKNEPKRGDTINIRYVRNSPKRTEILPIP